MNRLLKLQHHKHTGKLIHHRHTSYRALFLIVAMVGVVMVLTSQAAKADNYTVTATVPAPMPSGLPIIQKPRVGMNIVHTPNITINGTCPVITPSIVIALYDNSGLAGSQQCTPQGVFDVPISLSEGSNSIVATIITITGQVGASSQPVIITYTKLGVPKQTTSTSPRTPSALPGLRPLEITGDNVQPLKIISDNALIIFGPSSDAVWRGTFTGGTLPYKVKITWGDSSVQELSGIGEKAQAIRHHYSHFTSYQIKVQLTDAKGLTVTQYLTAITFATTIITLGNLDFFHTITSQAMLTTLILYSLYIVTAGLLLILWRKEHHRRLQPAHAQIIRKKRKTKK
ncbi:MAG: hypothetical protein ACMG55_09590 [Microcoleus sp.]